MNGIEMFLKSSFIIKWQIISHNVLIFNPLRKINLLEWSHFHKIPYVPMSSNKTN